MNATTTSSTTTKLDAGSPEIARLLNAWHENGRDGFGKRFPSLDYDSDAYRKTATDRRLYVAMDEGTSGVFLIDRNTGTVYPTKAYGVPNRAKPLGTVAELSDQFEQATSTHPAR